MSPYEYETLRQRDVQSLLPYLRKKDTCRQMRAQYADDLRTRPMPDLLLQAVQLEEGLLLEG